MIDASPGNLNGEISTGFRLQSSLETVAEFRVESSNYPAEYGTGTGGSSSITCAGTALVKATKTLGDNLKQLAADALDHHAAQTHHGHTQISQGGIGLIPIQTTKTAKATLQVGISHAMRSRRNS